MNTLKVDVTNVLPEHEDLLERSKNRMKSTEINWDNPFGSKAIVLTRLNPTNQEVLRNSEKLLLARAYGIPILDYKWLICSSIIGKWLPKYPYFAEIPEHNPNLFKGLPIAVNLSGGKEEENIALMATALGGTTIVSHQSLNQESFDDTKELVYICASGSMSSAWGLISGSWIANVDCAELGIPASTRTLRWFHSCVIPMYVLEIV